MGPERGVDRGNDSGYKDSPTPARVAAQNRHQEELSIPVSCPSCLADSRMTSANLFTTLPSLTEWPGNEHCLHPGGCGLISTWI